MRRLRPLDLTLLGLFLPIWLFCFGLYLSRAMGDHLAWTPVFVMAPSSTDGYPTVRGFWLDRETEQTGIMPGDQLVRVGDTSLRGVGPFGFVVSVYEAVDSELRIPVSFLRGEIPGEATLTLRRIGLPWRMLPLSVGFAATAILALLRAPSPRLARMFFLAGMTYSLYWTYCFGGGPRALTYVWVSVFCFASFFMFPLWVRTILLFAEELAPTGARLPLWPWVFLVYGLAMTSMAFGTPFSHLVGLQANFVLNAGFAATMLIVLVLNFHRTGPIGRRQLKWVVYGIYLSATPVFAADMVMVLNPAWIRLHEIATLSLLSVPFCLFIAIVRFNLFDIDRLLSATAAYSVLLVALIGGGAVVAPQLSQAASVTFGVESPSGHLLFFLFFMIVALPGHRYLRSQVDRLFFTDIYTLEQGVKQVLKELPMLKSPQAVLHLLGERFYALVHAGHCVIYEQRGESYVPTVVHGSISPTFFPVSSPLTAALQTQALHGNTERWFRAVHARLQADERSILDSLQAEVILPIGWHEPPLAFVCMGPKRSGDVYTATDITLLNTVVAQISHQLSRFVENT